MLEQENQEARISARASIRKLLEATWHDPVLTPEECLLLGAYFARGDQEMVTIPLALMAAYDEELHYYSQQLTDTGRASEMYVRLHAKLEEYLPVKNTIIPVKSPDEF